MDAGEGRWRIRNRFTGKFIDLALGGVVEGTWLHQWGRTSGLSQCWELESTRNGRTRIAFYPLTGRTHQRPCRGEAGPGAHTLPAQAPE